MYGVAGLAGGAPVGDFSRARRLSGASHNSLCSDRWEASETAREKSSNPRNACKTSHPVHAADITARERMGRMLDAVGCRYTFVAVEKCEL